MTGTLVVIGALLSQVRLLSRLVSTSRELTKSSSTS